MPQKFSIRYESICVMRDTYFAPAVIVGHVDGVQNSDRVPYKMFT